MRFLSRKKILTLKKMDLEVLSRQTDQNQRIKKGSILHESSLGGIYYALGTPTKCIIKTFNLNDQNIYCIAKTKRSTLRGLHEDKILYSTISKSDARDWLYTWCGRGFDRASYRVCKIAWLTAQDIQRDGATKLMRVNEYLCESIVGLIVSQLKIPHIVRSHAAWIDCGIGHIVQDYAGHSLQKSMIDLSLDEFKSIIMQVLITLALTQDYCQLKHHDVHLENIFITKNIKESFEDVPLISKSSWSYTVGTSEFHIPHSGVLVKIGDFGLSSVTDPATKIRYERVDYSMLNGDDSEWGEWSGQLDGQQSYDVAVFLSKFFLEDECGMCPKTHSEWAQNLYIEMKKENHMESTNIGRPIRGREGNIKITDLLKISIFDEFRVSKDSLKIV
jgi:serine/threonine protein kinase